jgi:polysaccharide biosynthesis/export protein
MRLIVHIVIWVVLAQLGCSSAPPPPPATPAPSVDGAPEPTRPLPAEYRLRVGDELRITVLGAGEFNNTVTVRPDGMISPVGVSDFLAAGRTIPEITEEVRTGLARVLRYPDVSVMLSRYADQLIYVLGEVYTGGTFRYTQDMTALHAVAAAQGPQPSAKMSNVLVLRRTGPTELAVFKIDLEAPLDGDVQARDIFLEPYDIVYVPRSIIAEINKFVEQVFARNIAPFYFYQEGWKAFHMERLEVTER